MSRGPTRHGTSPDREFHSATDDDPVELLDRYRAACDRSRAAAAADAGDLDALSAGTARGGDYFSLRWILLHMLEKTARHNGHAALLCENLDGVTGV